MKRKDIVVVGLTLMLVIGLIIAGCAPAPKPAPVPTPAPAPGPAPAPETIKLGFASIWAANHYTHVDQFPNYFKMVEKATKGKYILDIKYYPVGTLVGGAELYDGVVKGIAESGCTSFGYTPGRFPVTLTMNQPGIAPPRDADAAAAAMWEFYSKYKPKELDDVKILYIFATGPGYMHSKKPIRSVAEMKGLKIRVTGAGIEGVKAVEGEPIAMPMGEVYEAAQKGLIDANVGPPEILEGWKQAEIFDYSTSVPYFYSEFFPVAMNLTKWNALPKDLQSAFDAVAKDAVKEGGQIWQYQQKRGFDFAKAKPKGHEIITLSDAEAAKMLSMLKVVREKYVATLNGKGFPGEQIATDAAAIVDKYNKMTFEPWKKP